MSQGGFLSLRVALTAPERVRALILLDTGAGARRARHARRQPGHGRHVAGRRPGRRSGQRSRHASSSTTPTRTRSGWPSGRRARRSRSPSRRAACSPATTSAPRLGEITCPALVVHGTDDTAITMEHAEAMAAALVGCGGVVKVGGAHAANLTNPEPVNAAILDFLAGLPA